MKDYSEIIEKLKDILSSEIKTRKIFDKDIAISLNIEPSNFRKQKSRNVIPYPEIMAFLAKRSISINWFFFNQLPESLIEETSNYIILRYQKSVTASAGGGAENYDISSTPLTIDKQLLDHINSSYKYTEVIQVTGESMEPYINDNSLVFVDKSKTSIKSSGTYIINTSNGLVIKRIKIKNDVYYLESTNELYKEYKDKDFQIIGEVKGVLTKI